MNLLISAAELHQKLSLLVKDLHKDAWNFLAVPVRTNLQPWKAIDQRRENLFTTIQIAYRKKQQNSRCVTAAEVTLRLDVVMFEEVGQVHLGLMPLI